MHMIRKNTFANVNGNHPDRQADGANLKQLVVQCRVWQHIAALDRLHWLLGPGQFVGTGGVMTTRQAMFAGCHYRRWQI